MLERLKNYKKQLELGRLEKKIGNQAQENLDKFKVSEALLICGEPRGGTTWLAELLTGLDNTSMLWEPLHPDLLRKQKGDLSDWSNKQGKIPYVPENAKDEVLHGYIQGLFNGTILSYDLLYHNSSKNWYSNERWLIKFCRAGLVLPWIVANFELTYKPIYLIRHPLAVVSSQMRHSSFDHFQGDFELPISVHNDYFEQFKDVINRVHSKVEHHAAFWALNNALLLNGKLDRYVKISYEGLVADPENEFAKIESAWDRSIYERVKNKLRKPSHSTKAGSNILTGGDQLSTYKKYLSQEDQEKVMSIVEEFGIKTYSINDPMPNW